MKPVSLIVTDKYSNLVSKNKDCLIFIWDEFKNDDKFISVPNLVEQKASKYRSEFLDWIHFFSKTRIQWRRVVSASHGINETFSTGSQNQKPPQPSS